MGTVLPGWAGNFPATQPHSFRGAIFRILFLLCLKFKLTSPPNWKGHLPGVVCPTVYSVDCTEDRKPNGPPWGHMPTYVPSGRVGCPWIPAPRTGLTQAGSGSAAPVLSHLGPVGPAGGATQPLGSLQPKAWLGKGPVLIMCLSCCSEAP